MLSIPQSWISLPNPNISSQLSESHSCWASSFPIPHSNALFAKFLLGNMLEYYLNLLGILTTWSVVEEISNEIWATINTNLRLNCCVQSHELYVCLHIHRLRFPAMLWVLICVGITIMKENEVIVDMDAGKARYRYTSVNGQNLFWIGQNVRTCRSLDEHFC